MDFLSWSNLAYQVQSGFDLAWQYFGTPAMVLGLVAAALAAWFLINPRR